MNSYKNITECRNRDNNSKTVVNSIYTQVSLRNAVNYKAKENVFNYKNKSTPDKDSYELDELLEKLLIAYEYMTPAVEEIITTFSDFIMPKMQTYEQDDPICSITTEQYDEVVKAVMLIKDATTKKKLTNKSILTKFSLDKFLNGIKCSIKVGSVTTSTFRIYLEKTVVNELVLLYKLLYDEIQDIHYSSDAESEVTPSTQRRISSISQKLHHNISQNSEKLASLEAEYAVLSDTINILKSVISETTGSGYDIMSTTKSTTEMSKKIKPSNSVSSLKTNQCITDASGARRCILECLHELTEVRRHLKISNSKEDVEMKSNVPSTISKINCCSNQEIPHVHAKLNGIPIVLTLNKIKCQWSLIGCNEKELQHCSKENTNLPKTIYMFSNNRETNKLDRYEKTLHSFIVDEKRRKQRSIHTVTSSKYQTFPCYFQGDELNRWHQNHLKMHTNVSLDFSIKKDNFLKLNYYIYLSKTIYEHAQKVYEVRFFEIEQDKPSKEKPAVNSKNTHVEKVVKEIKKNVYDDSGWSSDTLEIRVFEFKRKNVSNPKELKTKTNTGHLNKLDNDGVQTNGTKGLTSNTDAQQKESAVVFTYPKKLDKKHKSNQHKSKLVERVNFDSRQCSYQQNKASVKTSSIGVNTKKVNKQLLPQTPKTANQFFFADYYNDLNHYQVRTKNLRTSRLNKYQYKNVEECYKYTINISSSNSNESNEIVYVAPWKTNENVKKEDSYSKIRYCQKKSTKTKSVQCNFLSTSMKTKSSTSVFKYLPKEDIQCLPVTPKTAFFYQRSKPIKKILNPNTMVDKISKSSSCIHKSCRDRMHLLRRRLSNFSKSSDKYWGVTLDKNGLKRIFNEETIYSAKINPKLNIQKSHLITETSDANMSSLNGNQEIPKRTKSKSTPNFIDVQNDLNGCSFNNFQQTDLQNFIINLMQTEASVVFENLGFKMSEQRSPHIVSVETTTKHKKPEEKSRKTEKLDRINALYFKDKESLSENSIGSISSTYSNIQFVYGDVIPTKNHKIFKISRSISNLYENCMEDSAVEHTLKMNIEKESSKGFDYSKYSWLVDDPPVLIKKTDKKLNNNENNRSSGAAKTKDKINHVDYSFYSPYMQFCSHKSTQLPPIIYRSRPLFKRIPWSF